MGDAPTDESMLAMPGVEVVQEASEVRVREVLVRVMEARGVTNTGRRNWMVSRTGSYYAMIIHGGPALLIVRGVWSEVLLVLEAARTVIRDQHGGNP